jgi:hypothetical protein
MAPRPSLPRQAKLAARNAEAGSSAESLDAQPPLAASPASLEATINDMITHGLESSDAAVCVAALHYTPGGDTYVARRLAKATQEGMAAVRAVASDLKAAVQSCASSASGSFWL